MSKEPTCWITSWARERGRGGRMPVSRRAAGKGSQKRPPAGRPCPRRRPPRARAPRLPHPTPQAKLGPRQPKTRTTTNPPDPTSPKLPSPRPHGLRALLACFSSTCATSRLGRILGSQPGPPEVGPLSRPPRPSAPLLGPSHRRRHSPPGSRISLVSDRLGACRLIDCASVSLTTGQVALVRGWPRTRARRPEDDSRRTLASPPFVQLARRSQTSLEELATHSVARDASSELRRAGKTPHVQATGVGATTRGAGPPDHQTDEY
jgi:hypothetical protein